MCTQSLVLLACPRLASKTIKDVGSMTVKGTLQGEIKIRIIALKCDTAEEIPGLLRGYADALLLIPQKDMEVVTKMAFCNRTLNDIGSPAQKEVSDDLRGFVRDAINDRRFSKKKMIYLKGIDPIDVYF